MREIGDVFVFDILDDIAVVRAALEAPGVSRFAAVGCDPHRRWGRVLEGSIESHSVERDEVTSDERNARGFRVRPGSRSAIAALFVHNRRRPFWYINHWWAYSDEAILLSCYDWPDGPNFLHPSLEQWGRDLESAGVIRITHTHVFTAEWYDGPHS